MSGYSLTERISGPLLFLNALITFITIVLKKKLGFTLSKRLCWYVPEGFVHRPVPTDEGAGGEEEKPEDGKTKAHSIIGIHTEDSQTGDEVNEQSACCD